MLQLYKIEPMDKLKNLNKLSVFILAGGFGTRLQDVVKEVPKPMAPILNKPFLEYQINEIRKYYPKSNIYLLTHYMSEVIENYFKNDELITIIKEETPLGTGGSIKNAIKELGLDVNDSLLVFNGDTYIKPDLKDMVTSTKIDISILASYQNNCDRYGTLTIKDNFITEFNEKQIGIKDSYINAGCYYFKNLDFFNQIKDCKFAIEDKFKEYLLSSKIGIFKYNSVFIDIGIPEDYKKMINYMKEYDNGN